MPHLDTATFSRVILRSRSNKTERPDRTIPDCSAGQTRDILCLGLTWQWDVGFIWAVHSVLQNVYVRVIVAFVYPD